MISVPCCHVSPWHKNRINKPSSPAAGRWPLELESGHRSEYLPSLMLAGGGTSNLSRVGTGACRRAARGNHHTGRAWRRGDSGTVVPQPAAACSIYLYFDRAQRERERERGTGPVISISCLAALLLPGNHHPMAGVVNFSSDKLLCSHRPPAAIINCGRR